MAIPPFESCHCNGGAMFRMPVDRGAQESRAKPRPKSGSAVQIHREIVGRWHFGTLRNTLNTTRLHLRGGYCEWQRVSVEGKFWINRAHRRRPSLEKQSLVLYWSTGTWLKTVRPNWERPCFQKHLSTLWNPRAVGILFQLTIDPLSFCTINTGPIKDKSACVMWIFIIQWKLMYCWYVEMYMGRGIVTFWPSHWQCGKNGVKSQSLGAGVKYWGRAGRGVGNDSNSCSYQRLFNNISRTETPLYKEDGTIIWLRCDSFFALDTHFFNPPAPSYCGDTNTTSIYVPLALQSLLRATS